MNVLNKYKTYLAELDYPNINTLKDDQIADLFGADSRIFLLSWLIKKINGYFVTPSDDTKHTEVLADFIYDTGFCTADQKLSFVTGDVRLQMKDQVIIFNRLFNYAITIEKQKHTDPSQIGCIFDNELDVFVNKNINIFPAYGPMKLRTPKQRQEKILYYQTLIENLKNQSDKIVSSEEENGIDDFNYSPNETNTAHLQRALDKVNESVLSILSCKQVLKEQKYCFQPNFQDIVIECNNSMQTVLQHIKNINNIHKSGKENVKEVTDLDKNSELNIALKQLAPIASEVSKAMKNNKIHKP